MKKSAKIFTAALAFITATGAASCGAGGANTVDGSVNSSSAGKEGVDYNGTINILVPFDNNALTGLNAVKNQYRKLHPEVTVNIVSNQSDNYAQSVEGCILAPDETKIDIVQINVVSQYYGTDKIVDFSTYLNQRNPYGETLSDGKYPVWKDMLDEEAYFVEDSAYTIPALSFESNYLVACYSKQIFEKYNWEEPTNWADFLTLLKNAKDEGYTSPLALNYDKAGVEGVMFGYVLYEYLDQYFRDMIDEAHSRDGDFSYVDSIDYGWEYDPFDPDCDARSGYTYNVSRLIDAYFNKGDFGATSARFADMMANFYDLVSYSSSSYNSGTSRNYFHNAVLTELGGTEFKKSESAVVYVCRMDYLSDFQSSIGSVLKFEDELIPADRLSDYLGWFELPAMSDNPSVEGGAPAAESVRTFGGPNHHPMGVINHNDQKHTTLVMDFMKFWYSPTGMDYYYSYYGERGIVCPLKCLVKDYEYPENIRLENNIGLSGICTLNPYFEIGMGYDSAVQSSDGGTVRDKYVETIRSYLGGATSDWTSYGKTMDRAIRSGFADWADRKNLKVSDPAKIVDYIRNSPYKVTQ